MCIYVSGFTQQYIIYRNTLHIGIYSVTQLLERSDILQLVLNSIEKRQVQPCIHEYSE